MNFGGLQGFNINPHAIHAGHWSGGLSGGPDGLGMLEI